MPQRLPKRLKSLVDGMKKKILITATELNLVQFWVAHIENLIKSGCTVDIVCSDVGGKLSELKARLQSCGNPQITVVDLKRSPLSPHNIRGAAQMKRYLNGRDYDLILTNEPVMGMVTRFAASKKRRSGCKVIYFAHGFHFWRGAPALNWMLFYPLEMLASYFTDAIVTMNREDFELAKKSFGSAEIKYIHGIGINLSEFEFSKEKREKKRKELGVSEGDVMIFSANELTKRKNVFLALEAVKLLVSGGMTNIKYFIRGQGPLQKEMQEYINNNKLQKNVFLLGYGKDIAEMDSAADVFLFTSKQEGLPVAVMEAMAQELPCVVSDIRGVTDLIQNGSGGYVCRLKDAKGFADAVKRVISEGGRGSSLTSGNSQKLADYEISSVSRSIINILQEI